MIEQYVYDKIEEDETLQELLSAGSDGIHLYPGAVERGVEFERAVTFTLINTGDAFPTIQSRFVQFNIFAKRHSETAEIADALANLFNEDNNNSSDGVDVVFSIRQGENDLGRELDEEVYFQRQVTYKFIMR